MTDIPKARALLLCLAIVAALLSVGAFESGDEVLSLLGGSWLAIAGALVAAALLP